MLGLHGPCTAYDTSCSSGLVASHAAMRALQCMEISRALVAAVNLMLIPGVGLSFAIAGMTSTLGRSHTFDARADGYVRAEACASTVLSGTAPEPIDALPLPSLIGSSVRQDGRSASLTAPNGLAQQALLDAALANAAIVPEHLDRVEAHGTGTALGDPLEARSLALSALVVAECSQPLALGGIKANIGHAEAAAGLVGLLNAYMVLQGAVVPPNAQLQTLNPHVHRALAQTKIGLSTQLVMSQPKKRAAGSASSFGYNGTIAHCIMGHSGGLHLSLIHI